MSKNPEAVIGLEIHVQLATASKIFATSGTTAGEAPNSLTDPVTLGLPGCLPVLNKKVVDHAIKFALATNCEVQEESVFARKHYHYPDLPKGYQISQYEKPICLDGHIDLNLDSGTKRIGITRIHLEEDAGKSVHHDDEPISSVDLNRAGVPLCELVSEPDIRTPEEAGAFIRTIRQIVRYIDISDGNMEEGSLRCDANISVRWSSEDPFGQKVEIKNLNSFRHVEKAIEYEISRQSEMLRHGQEIVQETRLWDEAKAVTKPMRSKEFAEDYRYFPCPDLPPLIVDKEWIENAKESMPELPQAVRARFIKDYGLDEETADRLSLEKSVAKFYDESVANHNNPKTIANWLGTELFGRLNKEGISMSECPVSPENLALLVRTIDEGTISGKIAKSVFDEMFKTGANPESIIENKGLKQITDTGAIEAEINAVLDENPGQVAEYLSGKDKVIGFFVGQIMKRTQGKANPKLVNEELIKALKKRG